MRKAAILLSGQLLLLWGGCGIALAAGWTPLRITIADKTESSPDKSPCKLGRKKTIGLDIGLLKSETCSVTGLQFSPAALSERSYGLQLGLIAAVNGEKFVGMQVGGLFTMSSDTENRSYAIQVAGLANNPAFMYPPSINGIQVAPIGNAAGNFNGMQFGAVNFLGAGRALQGGLLNIQVSGGGGSGPQFLWQTGVVNLGGDVGGVQLGLVNSHGDKQDATEQTGLAQIGVFNYSYRSQGAQIGIFNRAEDLSGVQVGVFNYCARTLKGVQIGFANVGGPAAILPYSLGINIGF